MSKMCVDTGKKLVKCLQFNSEAEKRYRERTTSTFLRIYFNLNSTLNSQSLVALGWSSHIQIWQRHIFANSFQTYGICSSSHNLCCIFGHLLSLYTTLDTRQVKFLSAPIWNISWIVSLRETFWSINSKKVNKIAATDDDDDACSSKKAPFRAKQTTKAEKTRAIFLLRNGKRRNKKSFDINVLRGV